MMRTRLLGPVLMTASLAGCHAPPSTTTSDRQAPTRQPVQQGVAWRRGDVPDALKVAKASRKPALLYWGAKWCAPCNRLKATLFRDPEFIQLTQGLVPIEVDGDDANAQHWGDRFHFAGYPTLILLNPDGLEIARPDPGQTPFAITQALISAAALGRSPDRLINQAIAAPGSLSAPDWAMIKQYDARTLAFGGPSGREKLRRLAAVTPDPQLQQRFTLLSLIALTAPQQYVRYEPVVLSDRDQQRVEVALWHRLDQPVDLKGDGFLIYYIEAKLLAALPASPQKEALNRKLTAATSSFRADASVPLPDKIDTYAIDLAISRNNQAPVSASFVERIKAATEQALAAVSDPTLRQSILHEAALLRRDAGDLQGTRRMLLANLNKLVNPEDAFERLSENAEMRGQGGEAVSWLRREYQAEPGPASRLRFAIDYSEAAMRLTPSDKASVEQSIDAVIAAVAHAGSDSSNPMRASSGQWLAAVRKWSGAYGDRPVIEKANAAFARACEATKQAGPSCVTRSV